MELGLLEAIRSVLAKFGEELRTLGLYIEKALPCPAARNITLIRQELLKRPWSDVIDAAARFNSLRSRQLERMAELFKSYPSLLKKAADPAQTPRKNSEHSARRLRANARWVVEDQSLSSFGATGSNVCENIRQNAGALPIDGDPEGAKTACQYDSSD